MSLTARKFIASPWLGTLYRTAIPLLISSRYASREILHVTHRMFGPSARASLPSSPRTDVATYFILEAAFLVEADVYSALARVNEESAEGR
jgi:hypothetical protein